MLLLLLPWCLLSLLVLLLLMVVLGMEGDFDAYGITVCHELGFGPVAKHLVSCQKKETNKPTTGG